jgi:hypothetical protein
MASQTISGSRRVGLLFLHLFLQRLVAGQAYIRTLGNKELVYLRFMRVMTLAAVNRTWMSARAFTYTLFHFSVASKTELSLFLFNHTANIAGMSVMAGKTLTSGKRYVYKRVGRLLHEIGMTSNAEF